MFNVRCFLYAIKGGMVWLLDMLGELRYLAEGGFLEELDESTFDFS